MAINSALNIFCKPGSRIASLVFFRDCIYRIKPLPVARCLLPFLEG